MNSFTELKEFHRETPLVHESNGTKWFLRTSRSPAMMIAKILGAAKAATLDNDSPDVLR